jgi:demethoxyubiquinone hydroxylase (CLK1/Coq7/Cat5 family)
MNVASVDFENELQFDWHAKGERDHLARCAERLHHPRKIRRSIMKAILSAIVALSVLTGVAASANAFDAKSFYEQLERSAR